MIHFIPSSLYRQLAASLLLLACCLATIATKAQAPPLAATAYTGPRYPGGPDSLRMLLYRAGQQVPGATGRLLVQYQQAANGKPTHFKLLPTAGLLNLGLLQAGATVLAYLEEHMLPWQPALVYDPLQNDGYRVPNTYYEVVNFSASLADLPYDYTDLNPVFSGLSEQMRNQTHGLRTIYRAPALSRAAFDTSYYAAGWFIQTQIEYPVAALSQNIHGRVIAYFEIAADGTIENSQILGTGGSLLDAEAMRAVHLLPNATTPGSFQGRPVRSWSLAVITFPVEMGRRR